MKTTRLLSIALATLMLSTFFPLSATMASEKPLMMATTTSTDNTGLLDYLMPQFEKDTGIAIKWTATGTGKALKLGQRCDVDVLLVHAPPAEKRYIDAGYGKSRREIMYNDFVIIGPESDPAHIKGKNVRDALETIRKNNATFVSRGDDSGTNKKEKLLWNSTGKPLPEKENWYIQAGQGMLSTIAVTEERQGYTMTDRGTYIKYQSQKKDQPTLKVLVQGDSILLNQYSVIGVNPENCPNAQYELAMKFSDWMAGARAQELIKGFRLLGKPLFTPNAK